MVQISFVKATQEYIDAMKGHLRESDEKACWALTHYTADKGLQYSFDRSVLCWVALVDGVPVAVCGIGRETMLSTKGTPWFSATDDISKVGFKIARNSKKYMRQMLAYFDLLETWVDVCNKVSVAWLKWCGFNIDKAEPTGLDKRLFHRCWLEKGVS